MQDGPIPDPSTRRDLDELERVLTRPLKRGPDAEPHLRPWRGEPGTALAVALPQDVTEVRSTVGWARAHRIRLIAQGAVTGLVGASTPPATGPPAVVVSTDALRSRIEIRAAEAVAVLDAGVRLSELNSASADHGLELPIDLAADPALGAMVATNTGGSRVLRHGDMSAHLLGVQAVLADEQVSVVGDIRGLRKDNTGPDPTRLLVGSAGSLGIITAVSVMLTPVPTERVAAIVGPIADDAAMGLLLRLRRSLGEGLSAFEVMCPAATRAGQAVLSPAPGIDAGHDPEVTVLVEASGPTGAHDLLVRALDRAGVAAMAVAVPPATAWGLRHAVPDGLGRAGEVIGFDLCVAAELLPELRAAVRSLVAKRWPELEVVDFGHWGDGGIHCNVVVPAGVDLGAAPHADLREAVYDLVTTRFDASWSAEHGVGPTNAAQWTLRTPAATRRSLAAQKAVSDPLGILGHPGLPF